MIHLSAHGLRLIAGYLDSLTSSERETGIRAVGHSGYAEISVPAEGGTAADSVLKVVRAVKPDGSGAPVFDGYRLEIED